MGKKPSKRQFERVIPSSNKPIRVDINGDNFMDILYAKDISMGGVAVIVPHGFKGCSIDGLVTLIIALPHQHFITVSGRILHLSQHAFGIQFIDLAEAERQRLKTYIYRRLKEHSKWTAFKYKIGVIQ